jgi:hypothetical protein
MKDYQKFKRTWDKQKDFSEGKQKYLERMKRKANTKPNNPRKRLASKFAENQHRPPFEKSTCSETIERIKDNFCKPMQFSDFLKTKGSKFHK